MSIHFKQFSLAIPNICTLITKFHYIINYIIYFISISLYSYLETIKHWNFWINFYMPLIFFSFLSLCFIIKFKKKKRDMIPVLIGFISGHYKEKIEHNELLHYNLSPPIFILYVFEKIKINTSNFL